MSNPTRAVAYYRMSTGKQEASIPEQREWAGQACPKQGVEVLTEFTDDGISGSEIDRRPGLMALLRYVEERGDVEALVVWDLDRFSRASSIETAAVLHRLMGAGVTSILTPERWYDLENDIDVLLVNVGQDFSRAAYS